jgi:hypothetical protein
MDIFREEERRSRDGCPGSTLNNKSIIPSRVSMISG